MTKLVAGNVEDLESLVFVLGVDGLKLLILWCEAASRGRIDDEQYLTLVGGQANLFAILVRQAEAVDIVFSVVLCEHSECHAKQHGKKHDSFHRHKVFLYS